MSDNEVCIGQLAVQIMKVEWDMKRGEPGTSAVERLNEWSEIKLLETYTPWCGWPEILTPNCGQMWM